MGLYDPWLALPSQPNWQYSHFVSSPNRLRSPRISTLVRLAVCYNQGWARFLDGYKSRQKSGRVESRSRSGWPSRLISNLRSRSGLLSRSRSRLNPTRFLSRFVPIEKSCPSLVEALQHHIKYECVHSTKDICQ